MSTRPDRLGRADDRLVTLISHWLARHVGDAELRAGVESIGIAELTFEQAELVDELLAELRDGRSRGDLEMLARETLECLAHG
jgi:hypothetical protein